MGTDNKARRAARKRKAQRDSRRRRAAAGGYGPGSPFGVGDPRLGGFGFDELGFEDLGLDDDGFAFVDDDLGPGASSTHRFDRRSRQDPAELVAGHLQGAVTAVSADPAAATEHARALLLLQERVPPSLVHSMLTGLLRDVMAAVVAHGWLPSDLAALAARPATAADPGVLAGLLDHEMRRHPAGRVAPAWRADLETLGPIAPLRLTTVRGLADALRVVALAWMLPVIATIVPPPGASVQDRRTAVPAGLDPKILARVRALLAKAESTEFPEEAESLSAKAQQLISRHALDRLVVAQADDQAAPALATARLWIDAPYVMPKAMLVGAVASANRCRSVVTEQLGFCTLVGTAAGIEAVELLSTSLLAQASSAMSRHGSQVDRRGRSSTRSFRQSFLVSYATRIGERLHEVSAAAADETGRSQELVPLLARHDEHVRAAVEELFPHLVSRSTTVSNGHGWAAGRVAADLAELDVRRPVTREAG